MHATSERPWSADGERKNTPALRSSESPVGIKGWDIATNRTQLDAACRVSTFRSSPSPDVFWYTKKLNRRLASWVLRQFRRPAAPSRDEHSASAPAPDRAEYRAPRPALRKAIHHGPEAACVTLVCAWPVRDRWRSSPA